MRTYLCVQYSPQWWETRRGVPTASQFDRVFTPGTRKPSKSQPKYIAELVGETADLNPNWFTDRPMNKAQRHGLDTEPEARAAYSLMTGNDVQMVGFCYDPKLRVGCSPDGLIPQAAIGGQGVLELKCVQMPTQVEYVLDPEALLAEYRSQVHGHLVVTGFDFVHLFSYAPGLDPVLLTIEPDDFTLSLAAELERFNVVYDAALAACKVKRRTPPADVRPARDFEESPFPVT